MKTLPSCLVLMFIFNIVSFAQNSPNDSTGTVTDIDGNVYQTVKIGDQWWMAENLKVTHYQNGDSIPHVTDNTQWTNLTTSAYCNYNNDSTNVSTYGRLYNWAAVVDSRKIAPSGWHVSTDEEFTALEEYLIANGYNWDGTTSDNKIGKSLASKTGWNSSSEAGDVGNDMSTNNSSGFTALPGGYRYSYGSFNYIDYFGLWWIATEYSSTEALSRYLYYDRSGFGRASNNKNYGFSVRCVKDGGTMVESMTSHTITSPVLSQNYPNPFNPSTSIEFALPKSEFVELKVYNILGKEVSTLVSKKLNQGNHTYTFDGSNLASGIYYYQLVAGEFREVKKMILLK